MNAAVAPAATHPLAGEYMTFRLGDERFGLAILQVRELIGRLPITRVPGAASSMKGVINLRGKVIPVMDLRARLGMSPVEVTEHTVIIVVQAELGGAEFIIGLQVDEALEVSEFDGSQLAPAPPVSGDGVDSDIVLGVGQAGDRITFLLDLDRVVDPLRPAAGAAGAGGAS